MIVKEIGRILISLCLLALAGGLFYFGMKFPEPAQALGIGSISGIIIGSVVTYWLKPS